MKLPVPQSDFHSQVQLTFRSDKWEMTQTLDDSHKEVEVTLPKGVQEDDVEVIALFLNKLAEPDKTMLPVCLKQKVVKPAKVEKKIETKVEVKTEPKVEAKAEVAKE